MDLTLVHYYNVVLAAMPSGGISLRLELLIGAGILSFLYFFFGRSLKSLLPRILFELFCVVILVSITEEIAFRLGIMEMVCHRILKLDLRTSFLVTTVLFVIFHPKWCKESTWSGRLLRAADAVYIGVICGAWYCMSMQRPGFDPLDVLAACIMIHSGCNLMVLILKAVLPLWLESIVRILFCMLYLYQLPHIESYTWRKLMIPFFLHG